MDLELELKRVADSFEAQGYKVTVRPKPENLPDFAKDFHVEIVARRGTEGVLLAVKKNRGEVEDDTDLQRHVEITGEQPGWRFDLAILEGDSPMGRRMRDIRDYSGEDINRSLSEAEQIAAMGFVRAAVISAWAALESSMRMRLRAAGESAEWGASPQVMMNELYSSGILTSEELRRLEGLSNLRNQIVHGFSSPTSEEGFLNTGVVPFLSEVARRLVLESQSVKQIA
jgi:hypothetical protein